MEKKRAFVEKYASLKGWDSDNLTQEQLSEIYQQEEYKKKNKDSFHLVRLIDEYKIYC